MKPFGQFRERLLYVHLIPGWIPHSPWGPPSGLVQLQRKHLDWCCPTEGSNRQPQAHVKLGY